MGPWKGRLAESFRPPLRPLATARVEGLQRKHRLNRDDLLAGQVSNLQPPDPKSGVLPVELPATRQYRTVVRLPRGAGSSSESATVSAAMGSLIKKRRKRMRKKKHRKMLKRTRAQRMRGR